MEQIVPTYKKTNNWLIS